MQLYQLKDSIYNLIDNNKILCQKESSLNANIYSVIQNKDISLQLIIYDDNGVELFIGENQVFVMYGNIYKLNRPGYIKQHTPKNAEFVLNLIKYIKIKVANQNIPGELALLLEINQKSR